MIFFYLELLNFSMLKPIVGTISCVCVCPPTRTNTAHKIRQVTTKGRKCELKRRPLPGSHVSTPLKMVPKDWNAGNKQPVMNQKRLHAKTHHNILTLDGLSWLMMVVLPLLSSPRHRTLTSFFLRPSQDDSLSSSPIGQHGLDTTAAFVRHPIDRLMSCC